MLILSIIRSSAMSVRPAPPSGVRPVRRASRLSGSGPSRPRTLLSRHTLRTVLQSYTAPAGGRVTARARLCGTRSRRPVTLAAGRCHAGGGRCHSRRSYLSRGLSQGHGGTSRQCPFVSPASLKRAGGRSVGQDSYEGERSGEHDGAHRDGGEGQHCRACDVERLSFECSSSPPVARATSTVPNSEDRVASRARITSRPRESPREPTRGPAPYPRDQVRDRTGSLPPSGA